MNAIVTQNPAQLFSKTSPKNESENENKNARTIDGKPVQKLTEIAIDDDGKFIIPLAAYKALKAADWDLYGLSKPKARQGYANMQTVLEILENHTGPINPKIVLHLQRKTKHDLDEPAIKKALAALAEPHEGYLIRHATNQSNYTKAPS